MVCDEGVLLPDNEKDALEPTLFPFRSYKYWPGSDSWLFTLIIFPCEPIGINKTSTIIFLKFLKLLDVGNDRATMIALIHINLYICRLVYNNTICGIVQGRSKSWCAMSLSDDDLCVKYTDREVTWELWGIYGGTRININQDILRKKIKIINSLIHRLERTIFSFGLWKTMRETPIILRQHCAFLRALRTTIKEKDPAFFEGKNLYKFLAPSCYLHPFTVNPLQNLLDHHKMEISETAINEKWVSECVLNLLNIQSKFAYKVFKGEFFRVLKFATGDEALQDTAKAAVDFLLWYAREVLEVTIKHLGGEEKNFFTDPRRARKKNKK